MSDDLTMAEIDFLRGLGSWSAAGERIGRIILLEKYVIASSRRVAWGGIDRERAIAFAKKELKKTNGRG